MEEKRFEYNNIVIEIRKHEDGCYFLMAIYKRHFILFRVFTDIIWKYCIIPKPPFGKPDFVSKIPVEQRYEIKELMELKRIVREFAYNKIVQEYNRIKELGQLKDFYCRKNLSHPSDYLTKKN